MTPKPLRPAAARAAAVVVALVAAACAPRQPVAAGPPPATAATVARAPEVALARFDWEGVYVDGDAHPVQVFAEAGRVWSVSGGGAVSDPTGTAPGRISIPGGNVTLTRAAGAAGWRMDLLADGSPIRAAGFDQVVDPFLGHILDRLRRGGRFIRVDPGGKRTRDELVLTGPVHARLRLPDTAKGRCTRGLLIADPSWNHSRKVSLTPEQPAAGKGGERTFLLLELHEDAPCEQAFPSAVTEHLSLAAGVRLFADATGAPIAALLVGYMFAEIFVSEGRTEAEIAALLPEVRREIEHQAE